MEYIIVDKITFDDYLIIKNKIDIDELNKYYILPENIKDSKQFKKYNTEHIKKITAVYYDKYELVSYYNFNCPSLSCKLINDNNHFYYYKTVDFFIEKMIKKDIVKNKNGKYEVPCSEFYKNLIKNGFDAYDEYSDIENFKKIFTDSIKNNREVYEKMFSEFELRFIERKFGVVFEFEKDNQIFDYTCFTSIDMTENSEENHISNDINCMPFCDKDYYGDDYVEIMISGDNENEILYKLISNIYYKTRFVHNLVMMNLVYQEMEFIDIIYRIIKSDIIEITKFFNVL